MNSWTCSYIIEYNFSGFNRIGRVRKSMTNFPVRPLCRPAHDTNTRTDNHSAAPVDHRKAPWVRSLASPTYNLINHPNKSASDFIIALWIRCIGEWNSYIHLMSGRLEERKQWKRERERQTKEPCHCCIVALCSGPLLLLLVASTSRRANNHHIEWCCTCTWLLSPMPYQNVLWSSSSAFCTEACICIWASMHKRAIRPTQTTK